MFLDKYQNNYDIRLIIIKIILMNTQTQNQSFSQAYAENLAKTGPKPKIYLLGISKVYLKGHPRQGQLTHFRQKIEQAMIDCLHTDDGKLIPTGPGKIHTIRPINFTSHKY